jgi:ATP-dependent helicase YprA (DUF1998 family)
MKSHMQQVVYVMQERREIEGALIRAELRAVCATNALELGIDVGGLDVTLHLGFPGSVASLWQQVRQSRPGCDHVPFGLPSKIVSTS